MEHEMRLAVIPSASGPMVVPYCIGCGWVGRHRSYALPDSLQSVPAEWRTHVKEFNESEDRRIAAWLEHQRARRDASARPDASPTHAQEATEEDTE